MKKFIVSWMAGLLILNAHAQQKTIDLNKIGEIFQFPGSELVLEDVTQREAATRKLKLDSAYLIMGKTEQTFLPILIYIADIGTFYNPKYDQLREFFRNMPKDTPPESGGTMGIIEGSDFTNGLITPDTIDIASLTRPKPDEPRPWAPQDAVGGSMLATIPSLKKDIHVFIVTSRQQITPIPGGEAYWENFHGRWLLDPRPICQQLLGVVLHSPLMTAGNSAPPIKPASSTPETIPGIIDQQPIPPESLPIKLTPELRKEAKGILNSWSSTWWSGIIVAVIVTVIFYLRQRRKMNSH